MTRLGTTQIDLDGAWAIASRFGAALPIGKDPIFESGFADMLDTLSRQRIEATLFVVGKDLSVPWKRRLVKTAYEEGHELANHTMNHYANLDSTQASTVAKEIQKAEERIRTITGVKTKGSNASNAWKRLDIRYMEQS